MREVWDRISIFNNLRGSKAYCFLLILFKSYQYKRKFLAFQKCREKATTFILLSTLSRPNSFCSKDRQTDRETERQTESETERDTDQQTQRARGKDREEERARKFETRRESVWIGRTFTESGSKRDNSHKKSELLRVRERLGKSLS